MISLNLFISIITLNVNGRNTSIERERLSDWIKKQVQLFAIYKKPTFVFKFFLGFNLNFNQVTYSVQYRDSTLHTTPGA